MQQGVMVENPDMMGHDELAGFLYVNTSYGCIFVEANDRLTRRRFSVAHELGHYLLHFLPLLEGAERDQEYLELTEALYRGKNSDSEELSGGRIERLDRQFLKTQLPRYDDAEAFLALSKQVGHIHEELGAMFGWSLEHNRD